MAVQTEYVAPFVSAEKVDEAVRRLVAAINPLQIIAFGSRARGDHRPDSDLDLAVILNGARAEHWHSVYSLLADLRMPIDVIVVSQEEYDLHKPWRNSVFNYIHREGIVLYDRDNPQRARPQALHVGPGRCANVAVSAA